MSVGRSALGVFASNALGLVLSFGNSILLTRTLGVEGRGEFAVFSASFGILSLLLGLGLDVSVRYFVARDQVPRERILSSLILYILLVSAFLFGLVHLNHVLFGNEFFLPASKQSLGFELVLVGVVAANLFYGNVSSVFAGTQRFKVLNLMSVGASALSLMVYGALLLLQRSHVASIGSDQVFVAYLGLTLFNAAILGTLAYRILGVTFSRSLLETALLRGMVRYAGLAFAANIAQFLNYRVDIWIVEHFRGSEALGLYALAANLAMMLWILPRSAASVLLPASAAGREGASVSNTARLGRLVFAATLLTALPLGLWAQQWIGFLYGTEFSPSGLPFGILLIGCVPFTLCIMFAGVLAGIDRQRVNLSSSLAGLAVTVGLDLLLIPGFGIEGAAWASAASYLVTAGIVVVAFSRIGGLPLHQCLVPVRGDLRYLTDGFKGVLR